MMLRLIAPVSLSLTLGCGLVASLGSELRASASGADAGTPLTRVDAGDSMSPSDAGAPPIADGGPGSDAGHGPVDAGPLPLGDGGSTDAAIVDAAIPSACGNGVVEPGEECDDGNVDEQDGCVSTCQRWWDGRLPVRARFSISSPLSAAAFDVPLALRIPEEWLPDGRDETDLCAVAADHQTVLPVEVEGRDADQIRFWVGLPTLPAEGTEVYVYLGDGSLCPSDATSIWSAYRAVWHMEGLHDSAAAHTLGETQSPRETDEGAFGSAFEVSSDGWLNHSPIGDLWLTGDMTLEAWVSLAAFSSANDFQNTIFQAALGAEQAYTFHAQNDGRLRVAWSGPYLSRVDLDVGTVDLISDAAQPLSLGTWHHVAMTRSLSEGVVRFFVDGQLLGTPRAFSVAPASMPTRLSVLFLGGNTNTLTRVLDGALDEVRIAASARSAEEIRLSHAAVAGTLASEPVFETWIPASDL